MAENENDAQLSGSTLSSIPESIKKEADAVANDMIAFVHKYLGFATKKLQSDFIQDLCIYIVERDMKVLRHRMGLELDKDKQLSPELLELSKHDATVHHYVVHYLHGEATYTGMLEALVRHLAKEKQNYLDMATQAQNTALPGPINIEGGNHA